MEEGGIRREQATLTATAAYVNETRTTMNKQKYGVEKNLI